MMMAIEASFTLSAETTGSRAAVLGTVGFVASVRIRGNGIVGVQ